MRRYLLSFLFIAASFISPFTYAQPPKVVVVIVLDQFPYQYITRFQMYFSKGGFRYLIKNGATFANAQYDHAHNKTAPGHAVISTGTYGRINGIISNSWYDRDKETVVNCVEDKSVKLIGKEGKGCSPKYLQTYTVGDVLRKNSNFKSKVMSISNKEVAAILLAGKNGSAFWFQDSLLYTSTYYFPAAPEWMNEFNKSNVINKYFGQDWIETLPSKALEVCDKDDAHYETDLQGLGKIFPHKIVGDNEKNISSSFYRAFSTSPFASEVLFDLARKIFVAETLGNRNVTDMLCISISATDEIGHTFGPNSHEVFDNVIRTDKMLEEFFSFLSEKIGLDNCLIALTSDHGVTPIPEYLKSKTADINAGRVAPKELLSLSEKYLVHKYGKPVKPHNWILDNIDGELYINKDVLKRKKNTLESVTATLKDSLSKLPYVAAVFTRSDIEKGKINDVIGNRVMRSFYPSRSGDVFVILKQHYIMTSDKTGTTHGQPYRDDSHVPMILCGKNVKRDYYSLFAEPIDLAPTIAFLLGIELPKSCEGRVLKEAINLLKDPEH